MLFHFAFPIYYLLLFPIYYFECVMQVAAAGFASSLARGIMLLTNIAFTIRTSLHFLEGMVYEGKALFEFFV